MKFLGKLALWLLSKLDTLVVFIIEKLYQLLIMIADTNVFGNLIYGYLGRIYTFLGVFMVFKLSLSMITYIINPDELTDKSKGAGKLVSNVIISLILLVATPTIFDQAFKLQADVLSTNAVYQIVTGRKIAIKDDDGKDTGTMSKNASIVGKQIAYGVYSAFIYNKDADGDIMNADPKTIAPLTDFAGSSETCDSETMDPYCLVSEDTILKQRGDEYVNKYHWLISTACGVAVAYMLLIFCLEVAKRAIKLGFLQIVAPIPILSLIDPKTGNKKLMDWAKECGKTFADLFIRLAGLFFAVEIIRAVLNPPEGSMTSYTYGTSVGNIFVRLFIIIGALMFAKQLPQLIESLFGIKLSGDGFSLKKTLGGIPGLGLAKAAGAGALGFAGGMAANSLASVRNHGWDKNKGFWRNVGGNAKTFGSGLLSAAGGGFSGMGRGLTSKEKNMFKAAGAGISGAVGARNLRDQRQLAGAGGIGGLARRTGAAINNWAGIESGASRFDAMSASLGEISSAKDAMDGYLEATNKTVKHNKAMYDAAVQKGDVAGADAWKQALDLSKDYAIRNAAAGSTEQVLLKKYNEKVQAANKLFAGASDSTGGSISFSEASGYADLKATEGYAKGTNTSLKNDGVSVGGRTWSGEHTGVKKDK